MLINGYESLNVFCTECVKVKKSHSRPEQPRGFQEVKAPRFQDIRHINLVTLSVLRTGCLYPQEIFLVLISVGDRVGTVVKLLRYSLEGRWFDSRWCHWNFSLT